MKFDRPFFSCRPQDTATLRSAISLALVILVGGILRFWGVGNIGLHGDEELMAMSARAIVEDGAPILPSGMYYARAAPQLYLMAASISIFGESEWALRLPSAIIGTFAILIAYFLARRFLTVHHSVGFALVFALLPTMIAMSQTARMYGPYIAASMLFAVMIFRWERTETVTDYTLAIGACLVALSLHTLTAFAMPLFFYPGILKQSWRLLGYGAAGFVVCLIAFEFYSSWISSQYYSLVSIPSEDDSALTSASLPAFDISAAALVVFLVVIAAVLTFLIARRRSLPTERAVWLSAAAACFTGAVVLIFLVQYHLATVVMMAGAVLGFRSNLPSRLLVALCLTAIVVMTVQGLMIANSTAFDDVNHLILALLGAPSPWPLVIFAGLAPAAVAAYLIIAAIVGFRFARGDRLPDHFLFALISVFAPLLIIGFFRGYMPERYVVGILPYFSVAVFAGAFHLLRSLRFVAASNHQVLISSIAILILLPMFVNPVDLNRNVNAGYEDFPHLAVFRGVDHKGAAEFIRNQQLAADDIVIAMDAQQQYYYLRDQLDYYLRSLNPRRNSSYMQDGVMVNLYTGTPQISTGRELSDVINAHRSTRVFIVGSGELESNPARYLGDGIWQTMQQLGLQVVYEGRDGATKVWRAGTARPVAN